MYKEVFSALGMALTFIAYYPYIGSIKRGQTKPHVFSWVIWGAVTFVVGLAQLADRGGVGPWPIIVSALITMYVAFLAYSNKADTSITKTDWFFFVTAMTSIPIWVITQDPLWAVIVLTVIDLLGFGPTIRKSYQLPFEESASFYLLMAIRNGFVLLALENYSMTTVMFPAVTGVACVAFVFMLLVLRRKEI